MSDLFTLAVALFAALFTAFHVIRRQPPEQADIEFIPKPPETLPEPQNAPVEPVTPTPVPSAPSAPAAPPGLLWATPKQAYHSTRVIADELKLTLVQKNTLCACIYQESGFLSNPKPNQNKDKTGKVWSTDYGIVQVNDYWNIGPGKPFTSVEEVIHNPEKCVRWMAGILKRTSGLAPWASWTSGAYRKWLVDSSPMWKLKS